MVEAGHRLTVESTVVLCNPVFNDSLTTMSREEDSSRVIYSKHGPSRKGGKFCFSCSFFFFLRPTWRITKRLSVVSIMHLSVCCRPMDCDRLLLYGSRLPLPTNCRRARHQLRLPASVTGWTRHQCSSSSHGRKPKNQVKFDLVSSFLSFSLCFLVSPKVLRSTFSFQLFARLTGGDADRRGPRCITIQRSSAGFGFTLRHFIVYPPDSVSVSDVAILDHLGVNELREREEGSSSCVRREMGFAFFFLIFFLWWVRQAKAHGHESV